MRGNDRRKAQRFDRASVDWMGWMTDMERRNAVAVYR